MFPDAPDLVVFGVAAATGGVWFLSGAWPSDAVRRRRIVTQRSRWARCILGGVLVSAYPVYFLICFGSYLGEIIADGWRAGVLGWIATAMLIYILALPLGAILTAIRIRSRPVPIASRVWRYDGKWCIKERLYYRYGDLGSLVGQQTPIVVGQYDGGRLRRFRYITTPGDDVWLPFQ